MTTRLTLATLNTRGLPLPGTRIAERHTAIATELADSTIDVACLQEVLTYRQLARLRKTFPYAAYRPSLIGPAGGLVTLSRLPFTRVTYARLPQPSRHAGIPWRARLNALQSGVLATELAGGLRILNVHPVANTDGDWSAENRFFEVQRAQLGMLARSATPPAVACGDFNISRESPLYAEFGLRDAFDGDCPPTFHADYLPPGSTPQCIDFIFVTPTIKVEHTALVFTDKHRLPSGPGHVSDHIGLLAQLQSPDQIG
ncbi:endonuclease/exonuclease/phosphatase family protein [Kribbella sp. NPDC054772]